MSSDLCILLTDNEPGLGGYATRADSARHSKRSATTTYSTMPCCTHHYDKNLIWSQ